MASWQFSMHLVPRRELAAVCPDLTSGIVGDLFDGTSWWFSSQPPTDLPGRLGRVLEEVPAWRPGSRQWGASEGSTVAVHYTSGRVDEIHARIDLREHSAELVESLAGLALESDGWWLGGDTIERLPIGQTVEAIAAAMAASGAARFVADPRECLNELNRKH